MTGLDLSAMRFQGHVERFARWPEPLASLGFFPVGTAGHWFTKLGGSQGWPLAACVGSVFFQRSSGSIFLFCFMGQPKQVAWLWKCPRMVDTLGKSSF